MAADRPAHARSLVRGLTLLELIADDPEGGGVTALAHATGLDKGTTSRLLSVLRDTGYVRQDPRDRRYRVTSKVLTLSQRYVEHLDLRALARPHLLWLRDHVDETVHLGVRDDAHVVYIDKVEAMRSIRLVSRVGHREPVETTALGRAILLCTTGASGDATAGSGQPPAGLVAALDAARDRGFAVDDEETQPEVTCVGAPIVDALGDPVAAISVSGPSYRMVPRLNEIGERCTRAAEAISRAVAGEEEMQ